MAQKNWSSLVLAACDGEDSLAGVLSNNRSATPVTEKPSVTKGTGAYLTSLAVEGFRGIGPRQTLTLTAGPGLTIIVGRNGSGKSSFAEALEVLLTSDNKRWSDRSKIWKEGWRNLHQAHSVRRPCLDASRPQASIPIHNPLASRSPLPIDLAQRRLA